MHAKTLALVAVVAAIFATFSTSAQTPSTQTTPTANPQPTTTTPIADRALVGSGTEAVDKSSVAIQRAVTAAAESAARRLGEQLKTTIVSGNVVLIPSGTAFNAGPALANRELWITASNQFVTEIKSIAPVLKALNDIQCKLPPPASSGAVPYSLASPNAALPTPPGMLEALRLAETAEWMLQIARTQYTYVSFTGDPGTGYVEAVVANAMGPGRAIVLGDVRSTSSPSLAIFRTLEREHAALAAGIATAKDFCAKNNKDKPLPPVVTRAEAVATAADASLSAIAATGPNQPRSVLQTIIELDQAGVEASTTFISLSTTTRANAITRNRTLGWVRRFPVEATVAISARGGGYAHIASAYCVLTVDPKEAIRYGLSERHKEGVQLLAPVCEVQPELNNTNPSP